MKKTIILLAIVTTMLGGCVSKESVRSFNLHALGTSSMYGAENLESRYDANNLPYVRVFFPAGSYDPGSMKRLGKPIGGFGQRLPTFLRNGDCAHLTYYVRFAPDFPFVKGGKLPGLAGGTGNTGGRIPTGYDGFSARLMWRSNGQGEVYAYLPASKNWGTSLGRGSWTFKRGEWTKIEEILNLYQAGLSKDTLKILINDILVYSADNLSFRNTDTLEIDKILFETFFGGNDPSWAPTENTYIDFAEMSVSICE